MTLETLGKAATDSMHASATGGLDVEAGLVTLKRTRTRRRHAKVAALVAAVAFLGWLAVAPGVGNRAQPAGHHPGRFPHSNGAIVGARDGDPAVLSEPAGSPPIDLGDLPPWRPVRRRTHGLRTAPSWPTRRPRRSASSTYVAVTAVACSGATPVRPRGHRRATSSLSSTPLSSDWSRPGTGPRW